MFALALTAGLADGIGILMLLPLLETLDSGSSANDASVPTSGISAYIYDFLSALNLEGSTVAILLIIAVAFLIKGLLLFGALGVNAYLRGQLLRELKGQLFDAYSHMQYGYYASRDTGHFINLLNEQVNRALQSFHSVTQLGSHIINALIYVSLAFLVAWRFGLMALVIGVILIMLFRWLNAFVLNLSRETAQENGHLSKLLIQTLHAFKYLTATGQTARLQTGITASIGQLASNDVRTGIAAAFTQAVREPIAVIFIMFIVLVQLVFLGQSLAPILISIVLFYRGLNSILQIQGYWQNSLEFIGSMELVYEEFSIQRKNQEIDGQQPLEPLVHGVSLKNVHFSYDPKLGDVIGGVDMEIAVRTSVALVGESGSGKSTLVDLITLMLKPQQGSILIDGLKGDQVQLSSWRNQIGYVTQDSVVFDDSIANNICLWQGDPDKDPELMNRVRKAARQAHLAQFIDTLPQGYFTPVGDRGLRISGGQRQRLAIARELFREPNLLILDEATSALDSDSERAIQQSIDELKGHVTLIIIAHRLSTIRNVDKIYVFNQGRIVEQGVYEDLRNTLGSRFERLVSMQAL